MNLLTFLLFGLQSSVPGYLEVDPENSPADKPEAPIGKIGHTITVMKLCGYVEINGKRYEAMSTISMKKNTPVKVTGQSFGLLRVEPITGKAGRA